MLPACPTQGPSCSPCSGSTHLCRSYATISSQLQQRACLFNALQDSGCAMCMLSTAEHFAPPSEDGIRPVVHCTKTIIPAALYKDKCICDNCSCSNVALCAILCDCSNCTSNTVALCAMNCDCSNCTCSTLALCAMRPGLCSVGCLLVSIRSPSLKWRYTILPLPDGRGPRPPLPRGPPAEMEAAALDISCLATLSLLCSSHSSWSESAQWSGVTQQHIH